MYSSVHGTVGAAIVVASPDPIIGIIGAFLSHFALDYIGEKSIGDTLESSLIEGTLLFAFIVGSYLGGIFWIAMAGWIAGNLPDLIDKPNRWFCGAKEWFSCHNGEGLFQYKGKKFGWPVIYQLTTQQTLLANTFSTIFWLVYCLTR